MRNLRHFLWGLWVAILLIGSAGAVAEEQPKLLPTRDVDIRYDVTRPQKPRVRERVRWLASEHFFEGLAQHQNALANSDGRDLTASRSFVSLVPTNAEVACGLSNRLRLLLIFRFQCLLSVFIWV